MFAGGRPVLRKWSVPIALLGSLAFVLLVVVASGSLPSSRTDTGPEDHRPNVLIFITDDQRRELEVMSAVRSELKRGGRHYPNAYVTTPSCCPSRATIMTGRYAHNHGVLTNKLAHRLDHRSTIQFYLQRAGYRTGYIGKFMNQWRLSRRPPFFTDWAVNSPGRTNREFYFGSKVNVNGDIRTVNQYSTDFFGDEALRFLERSEEDEDERPWLLYVAPNAPHAPYRPAHEYADAAVPLWDPTPSVWEQDRRDKPLWVRKHTVTRTRGRWIRRQQSRMLMSVDDQVQRVLSALDELDEQNTLVVYMSDNGYAWGDHGLDTKSSPYRESVQVPFLLSWPGHIDAGSVDKRLVANIDLAPTIVEATGASTAGGPPMDGRSLLDPTWIRERLLLEYLHHGKGLVPDWLSVVSPRWQYTEYYGAGGVTSREYYDLAKDPYQLRNLLSNKPGERPAIAPAIAYIRQARRCSGGGCP